MGNESIYFFVRRVSALMISFSVLLFLVRNAFPSLARQAIAISISLNMAGFAMSSFFGLINGLIGTWIIGVIFIEIFISAIYFYFFISDRRHLIQLLEQSNKSLENTTGKR
jgi:hypothetical protein